MIPIVLPLLVVTANLQNLMMSKNSKVGQPSIKFPIPNISIVNSKTNKIIPSRGTEIVNNTNLITVPEDNDTDKSNRKYKTNESPEFPSSRWSDKMENWPAFAASKFDEMNEKFGEFIGDRRRNFYDNEEEDANESNVRESHEEKLRRVRSGKDDDDEETEDETAKEGEENDDGGRESAEDNRESRRSDHNEEEPRKYEESEEKRDPEQSRETNRRMNEDEGSRNRDDEEETRRSNADEDRRDQTSSEDDPYDRHRSRSYERDDMRQNRNQREDPDLEEPNHRRRHSEESSPGTHSGERYKEPSNQDDHRHQDDSREESPEPESRPLKTNSEEESEREDTRYRQRDSDERNQEDNRHRSKGATRTVHRYRNDDPKYRVERVRNEQEYRLPEKRIINVYKSDEASREEPKRKSPSKYRSSTRDSVKSSRYRYPKQNDKFDDGVGHGHRGRNGEYPRPTTYDDRGSSNPPRERYPTRHRTRSRSGPSRYKSYNDRSSSKRPSYKPPPMNEQKVYDPHGGGYASPGIKDGYSRNPPSANYPPRGKRFRRPVSYKFRSPGKYTMMQDTSDSSSPSEELLTEKPSMDDPWKPQMYHPPENKPGNSPIRSLYPGHAHVYKARPISAGGPISTYSYIGSTPALYGILGSKSLPTASGPSGYKPLVKPILSSNAQFYKLPGGIYGAMSKTHTSDIRKADAPPLAEIWSSPGLIIGEESNLKNSKTTVPAKSQPEGVQLRNESTTNTSKQETGESEHTNPTVEIIYGSQQLSPSAMSSPEELDAASSNSDILKLLKNDPDKRELLTGSAKDDVSNHGLRLNRRATGRTVIRPGSARDTGIVSLGTTIKISGA